jgi:F0F1-type ATP synthase assembly protein I
MAERPPATTRAPRHVDSGDGWTLAMELLTATFFWGGVGWLLDGWLGTGPVLMALGFVLGNGLGIYLIWVRSQDRFVKEHEELLARRASRVGGAPAGSVTSAGAQRTDTDRPVGGRQPPTARDDHA